MITVRDSKGFTPFALAMFRRHFEVAKALLGIASVQFKAPDEDSPRRRYAMAEEGSDYSSESDEDDLGISSRIMDETFAYDNIAALKQQPLGSKVSGNLVADPQNE